MTRTTGDPWFQDLFADRIGGAHFGKGTAIYKFEKIKRAKRAALQAHPERMLLDFGIGENDDMADPVVRQALKREGARPDSRAYAENRSTEFRAAAAAVTQRTVAAVAGPAT